MVIPLGCPLGSPLGSPFASPLGSPLGGGGSLLSTRDWGGMLIEEGEIDIPFWLLMDWWPMGLKRFTWFIWGPSPVIVCGDPIPKEEEGEAVRKVVFCRRSKHKNTACWLLTEPGTELLRWYAGGGRMNRAVECKYDSFTGDWGVAGRRIAVCRGPVAVNEGWYAVNIVDGVEDILLRGLCIIVGWIGYRLLAGNIAIFRCKMF